MNRRRSNKSVFVVKSAPRDIDEKHKDFGTKNVYLLRDDEQAINKYQDTVYSFIDDQDGLFLVLSHDKTFFHNFRNSFYKELRIDQERVRIASDPPRMIEEIRVYRKYGKAPFLFVECTFDGKSTLSFIEEIKAEYPDMLVVLLMNDAEEKRMAQFLETGVDNVITKPVCVNLLVEKIANTLVPPDTVEQMIRQGKHHLRVQDYPAVYDVATEILELKPGSPAGLMLMGDALKGLQKRDEAFRLYQEAVRNAPNYLETHKKIVEFHKEDGDTDKPLEQLIKIDDLSPMNIARKQEIGDLHFSQGNMEEAERFYRDAVILMHGFREKECALQAEKYAHKIFKKKSALATELLRLCNRLATIYKVELHWSIYSQLGMLMRKKKQWREAVDAYEKAVELSPDDTTLLYNMGMAYVESGDYGSAAQKFERAINIDPSCYQNNLRMAYAMGHAFYQASRPTNATKVLAYVHSVNPNFQKVQPLLKSLEKINKREKR